MRNKDEYSICSYCNGSGEGDCDGSTCSACHGTGCEDEDQRRQDAEDERADYLYDQWKDEGRYEDLD